MTRADDDVDMLAAKKASNGKKSKGDKKGEERDGDEPMTESTASSSGEMNPE